MEHQKGLIAKVEPFAVHDGPGIRTVIFMKGCPLTCLWCPTPQMQKRSPELLFDSDRCRKCGDCIPVCPRKAVEDDVQRGIRIDRQACDGCGLCVESCPQGALEITGKYYSLADLAAEVEKDIFVYNRSSGGVTVSGGEPILQAEFVAAFLKRCRQEHIHTALKTSGLAPWSTLAPLLASTDLIYFDIKHTDKRKHHKLTGVSNEKIFRNIGKAAEQSPIILRIPLIPDLNDGDDNISDLIRFAKGLGRRLIRLDLIPFQKPGKDIYPKLNRVYSLYPVRPLDEETMKNLKNTIESQGLAFQIGG